MIFRNTRKEAIIAIASFFVNNVRKMWKKSTYKITQKDDLTWKTKNKK